MYAEHGAALLAYVRRLVAGDRGLAEDIVQETLVRAWQQGDRLTVAQARPWLFTTARRVAIDMYRARRARPLESSRDELDDVLVADGIDAALDAVVIADALAALSPAHREVLFESYYRGRNTAEVASRLGLPAGTVRSRLHYALRALRLALDERGVSR